MTRPKHTPRGAALCALVLLFVTAALLLSACGSSDQPPAISATTLFPSPSASQTGTGGSGNASPSPSVTASPSPSSTGASGGGQSSGGSSGSSTSKITDKAIRGNILVRLSQEPSLQGLQFKLRVRKGVVILTGRVKTKDQKRTAEQIAVSEAGVKKVLSYIEVTGGGGY